MNLTEDQLQLLHQAVTLVDYSSLFSYYGYQFGLTGGSWMIAKAIQTVAGGQLHFVELNPGAPVPETCIHVVVKLGDDAFMDSRGLQTAEQVLDQYSPGGTTNNCNRTIPLLFFFPVRLQRNAEVVETIAWVIQYQLEALGMSQAEIAALSRQPPDQSAELEFIYRQHQEREEQRQRGCPMNAVES